MAGDKEYMKHTSQISGYMKLALAAALSGCLIAGCTRADSNSSSQQPAVGNGTVSQGTVSENAQTLAGGGASSDSQLSPQTDAPAAAAESQTAASDQASQTSQTPETGRTAQNVAGTTTDNQAAQASSGTQEEKNSAEAPTVYELGEGVSGVPDELFNGEFEKSDGSESVQFSIADGVLHFAFETSLIASTADADGKTAVYNGEDGYSITFDVAGDTLGVVVDGEDAQNSPINGIYYRILEDDSAEEVQDYDEAADDMDETIYDGLDSETEEWDGNFE